MSKVKVSDLTNEQLDEWVARTRGWKIGHLAGNKNLPSYWMRGDNVVYPTPDYSPTSNPAQWVELIEDLLVDVYHIEQGNAFEAQRHMDNYKKVVYGYGPTPAIAICRAVVASVFGEYVEVEDV